MMLLETLKHILRDIFNYFNVQETINSIVRWFVDGMALGRLTEVQLETSLNPDPQFPPFSPEASDLLLPSETPNLPAPSEVPSHLTSSETPALETDSDTAAHVQLFNFSSSFLQGRTSWDEMPPGEDSDAVKLAIEANLKEAMRVSNVTLTTDILFENHCCDSFVRPDAIFELGEIDSLLTLAGEHVARKKGNTSEPFKDKKSPLKTAEGRVATFESARVASKPKSNTISEQDVEDQNLATKPERQGDTNSKQLEEEMLSRPTAHCVPATTDKDFDMAKMDATPSTSSKRKKRKNKKKKKVAKSPSPPPTACPGPSGETCPLYELCPQLAPWTKDKMYPSSPKSTKEEGKVICHFPLFNEKDSGQQEKKEVCLEFVNLSTGQSS